MPILQLHNLFTVSMSTLYTVPTQSIIKSRDLVSQKHNSVDTSILSGHACSISMASMWKAWGFKRFFLRSQHLRCLCSDCLIWFCPRICMKKSAASHCYRHQIKRRGGKRKKKMSTLPTVVGCPGCRTDSFLCWESRAVKGFLYKVCSRSQYGFTKCCQEFYPFKFSA